VTPRHDTGVPRPEPRLATRREALAAGLSAGLAASFALPARAGAEDRDGDILQGLIAREEAAAYAYRGVDLPGVGDLAAQDSDHVKALRTEFQALGRGVAPISADDLDPASRRLADAANEERVAAAIALEADLVATYRTAVLGLTEPAIIQAVATILACHAQNRALLTRGAR
jgi:hypothetical protein